MKVMKVCVGGTFNILQKGHKKLLDKAFEIAGENGTIFIGIIEGEMLKKKKFSVSLNERKRNLEKYLLTKKYNNRSVIIAIRDMYGYAVDMDLDAIIVSPETFKNAEKINKDRIRGGKKTLRIIQIPFVLAFDKKPISSTRIKNKEIDKEGKEVLD